MASGGGDQVQRDARHRATRILEESCKGGSSAWAAARQFVEECEENASLDGQIPRELREDLARLLALHEKSVSHEYVQDVVTQALTLER
jgi:hypothetical protein